MLNKLSFIFCLLFSFSAFAETQGPFAPSNAIGTNWTNPNGVKLSDDDKAIYNNTAQDDLILTNFKFNIPSGATITGIIVTYEGNTDATTTGFRMGLTKDGSSLTGGRKNNIIIPSSEVYVDSGLDADLWGTTWTPAEINSSNFGVLISDTDTSAKEINFDSITIIVHFTPAADSLSACNHRQKFIGFKTAGSNSGDNWTGAGNTVSSNDTYATYNNTTQDYLILTSFGFNVPPLAKITGVIVKREGNAASATLPDRFFKIALTKNGVAITGQERSTMRFLQTTDSTSNIGGSNDLWGTTLTPAEVNSPDFGVYIRDNDTTGADLNFDYVGVTVCFTNTKRMMRVE